MKLMHITVSLIFLASCGSANAALVLDLRLDDATRTRSVTPGSSVFIDMFLVDTDGTSAMSTGFGLIGGGGRILDAPSSATATGSFSAVGTGFSPPLFPHGGAGIASAQLNTPLIPFPPFFAPVAAMAPGAGITTAAIAGAMEVLIARFQVLATGGFGDTHTLTAAVLGAPANGNTALTFSGPVNLDALLSPSTAAESITLNVGVAAVPEPSSLLVAGLLGGGFLWCRRRRTNSKCLTQSS